jgi:hypothetical protein
MKQVLFLLFLLTLPTGIAAQECFQWKNLRLQTSSLAATVNILGKPDKDKIKKAEFDKSPAENVRELINFRNLRYKNIDNYREVSLLFLNEMLFGIEFTPVKRKILAADLGKNFNSEFLFAGGLSKRMNFADYEGQKETTVPKVYPANYYMLSVTRNCAIIAAIDNNSWKAVWRDGIKKPTAGMFPGNVRSIQIFSRDFKVK